MTNPARAVVTISRPTDVVGSTIGDFGDIRWIPHATTRHVDGDLRSFQLGGSIARHRLMRHDVTARSYTYTLATDNTAHAGERAPANEATLSVAPLGPAASTVTWTAVTDRRSGSSQSISAFFQEILDHLKNQLENA